MNHSRSVMPPGKTNLAVLEEEIRSLRRQADALNAPSTFAQSAKLSRKARALEKELETKRATQAELSKTINRTVSGFKVSERKLWEAGDGANRQWIRQSLTPPSLPSPPLLPLSRSGLRCASRSPPPGAPPRWCWTPAGWTCGPSRGSCGGPTAKGTTLAVWVRPRPSAPSSSASLSPGRPPTLSPLRGGGGEERACNNSPQRRKKKWIQGTVDPQSTLPVERLLPFASPRTHRPSSPARPSARKFGNFPRRARVLLIPLGPRPIKTKDFAFKTCSNGSPTAEELRSGPACTTDGVQGDAFERESSAPRRQLGLEWSPEPLSDQGLGRVSEGARERRPQLVPASTSSGVESRGGPRPASQGSGVKASDLPTLQWIAPSPGGLWKSSRPR